jgi:outer membrane immunogenic protein
VDVWGGWYVGLNVGGSFGLVRDTTNDGVLFSSMSSKLNGVIGGGQVGYNWHSGNWLLGLEATSRAAASAARRRRTSLPPAASAASLPAPWRPASP